MFFFHRTPFVLNLTLSPRAVAERFRSGMDEVRSLLFTPTWGLGRDFVGNLRDSRVEMRVRHAYSNGYTRLFFARIDAAPGGGTRLSGEFEDVRFVVVLMTVVWYAVLLPSLLYTAAVLRHHFQGGSVVWGEVGAALAGPSVLLTSFYVVERFGRWLGRRDERRMREHLDRLFADARAPDPPR